MDDMPAIIIADADRGVGGPDIETSQRERMDELTKKKCAPCEDGVPPLDREHFAPHLAQVPEWRVAEDEKAITRELTFKDFAAAMAFVNRVAALAEEEGHHPDFLLHGWNKVRFTLSTHAIQGLSINDFILAAKIDELLARDA